MDFELKRLDTEEVTQEETPIQGDFELRKIELTPEEQRPEYDPTPNYKSPQIEQQLLETGDLETAVAISKGDLPWALGLTRGISEQEFTRIKRISEATKLPKDSIKRNPKLAEDIMLSQNIIKKLTERDKEGKYLYPMTLAYFSDPGRAAEARSEYNNLADIERLYKQYYQKDEGFFKKSYRSMMTGLASINKQLTQVPALVYDIAALPQNLIADAVGIDQIRTKAPTWLRNNPLANYYEKQAELWKPMELDESFADLIKEEKYGDIAENILYQSISNVPNLVLMAAMNYASGGSAALATMGTLSASDRASRGAELGEDPAKYALASIAYGGAEALFERVTLGALQNFGKQLVKQTGKESAKQVMSRVGKLVLGNAVDEGLSEAATSIVQDFADYSVGEKADIPKSSLNALNSFLVGAATGGALSGASVMTQNLAKVNKAKVDVKGFKELINIAKGSELRTRSKAAFEEFVDTIATQAEAAKSFFVNLETVNQLFQDSDEDVFEFFERMGKEREDVKAAQETGSDIELNTAKFLAEYGDTEIAEKLAPEVRFQADGMSEKEATEYQKEVDERVKDMQEEYQQHVKENTIPPSIMKIRSQLIEEFGVDEKEADAKISLVMAASEVFAREYGVNRDDYIENKLNLELRVRPEGKPEGLFQYAGEKALQSDKRLLAEAIKMSESQLNPEQIRKETGWFKGLDGKWRFEFSDREMTLKKTDEQLGLELEETLTGQPQYRLKDLIDHKKLFNNYPELSEYKVRTSAMAQNVGGYLDTKGKLFVINPFSGISLNEVFIHEIQHAIQDIEGFNQGGQVKVFTKEGLKEYRKLAGELEAFDTQFRAVLNQRPDSIKPYGIAKTKLGIDDSDIKVLFQGPKGSIQFFDDKNVINLFEKADMSTFLHETGHLFINEMDTLVSAGKASKQMQSDFEALKEFAGDYDSREGKEKLAQAFEMYLREGKAPSTKLLSAFRKFRNWLTKIYRTVKNLDVNINDGIRNVFDRMLASQDEINEVQEYYRSKEIEKSIFNEIDLSKTSKERLQKMRDAARDKALDEQVNRALNIYYKSIGGVDKLRQEAVNEVENDPVYQSVDYIIDSGGLTNSILDYYLNPDDKKEVIRKHTKRKPILGKDGKPVLNAKGNPTFTVETLQAKSETYELPLADILSDFGVGLSEQEFMSQLVTKPSKPKAIEERTNQLKAYAEEQIRQELEAQETIPGEESYHTEEQYKYLIEEGNEVYNYLYRLKTGKKPSKKFYNGKVYKDAAREILLKMPVRQAVQYNKYSAAEAKYSKEVYEAIKKQDLDALEEAKEKQLRNHAMVSVAVELNKQLGKIEKKLKSTANKKQGLLLGDYQDVIKDVLQKYGVVEQGPKRPDKLNPQAIFNEIENVDAIDPIVLPDVVKSPKALNYKDLTYDELIDLNAGIAILAARGRNTVNLGKNFEGVPIEDIVNKSITPMQGRKRKKPPARYSSLYKFKEGVNSILAETIHVQFDLKAADNYTNIGKDNYNVGPNEAMFDLVKEKHDEVNRTLDKFNKEYMDDISKEFVKMHNRLKTGKRGIDIPGVPVPRVLQEAYGQPGWTSEMIVSFVLNMGNQGNLDTLLAGYDLTMEQALKVAGTLTKSELQTIQGVWNAINTLFDSMDDTFYRLNGYRLKKVEPQEITIPLSGDDSITLEGGYYPISHDRKLSRQVAGYQEKDLLQNEMQSVYHRAKPKDSQTKERIGSKYPIALHIGTLYKHINDTVRYTNLAPVLTDVHKVMNNKLYAKTYSQLMGDERYNILTPWLSHIARPESRFNDVFERITQRYQSLSAIGALGVNLLSLSKQALSLTSSIQKLGLLPVMGGMKKMAMNPFQSIKDIESKSIFMKDRGSKVEQEIAQQLQKISPFKKGIMLGDKKLTVKDLQDFALINIRIGDIMGAYPTWIAGYNKALNMGQSETDAIKFADKVVSETQPVLSSMFKNLWQMGGANATGAGKLLRWVTSPFTGWTMKFGSRSRTYWRGWREGAIPTKEFARHVFYERLLPPMLASVLIGTLRDEKLDDPDLYLYELLSYQLSWIPGINQIPGAIKYFGFGGTMELPQGKTITNTAKVMKKAFNKDVAGFAQALAEFAEFETGIPAYKTYKEFKRTSKALSGEE